MIEVKTILPKDSPIPMQEGPVNLSDSETHRTKRIIIGVDPSIGGDHSALVVIFEREHIFIPAFGKKKVETDYILMATKSLAGSLVAQADEIVEILHRFKGPEFYNVKNHPAYFVAVDKTGLGAGLVDILQTMIPFELVGVTITSGFNIGGSYHRLTVPRTTLIENLQRLIQRGKLKIAACEHRDLLMKELESFRSVYDGAGRLKFEAGISRSESHADFSFALAVGLIASEQVHEVQVIDI